MPQAEEEMEVIHHRSQLVITRSRIARWFIADPSVIDVIQFSPNEISVIGTQMGATHLTLWFEGDAATDPVIYRVEVIRDPSLDNQQREEYGKLERQLQVLFPNSQVYLVPLTFRLIVKGQARDQEEAAQIMNVVRAEWIARNGNGNWNGNGNGGWGGGGWGGGGNGWGAGDWGGGSGFGNNNNNFVINMLEVPGEQQIIVHVKIAQLDRTQVRKLGLDFPNLISRANLATQTTITGSFSPVTGAGALSGIFENAQISLLLNWLAQNGTAKIVANPSITVMNGTTGSFISGGEFAVPTVVGVGGAQGTTTTFRGFGTSLIVTPTIIDKDLIRLRIVPEFSAINTDNTSGGVPGLDTRRVTSVVQLREGQTIALAGLYSHQSATGVTRMPFLGELPYIGPKLFNGKTATMGETELLFLVTPEIVRPMEQDEVPPVPGFYVTHPNDYELYHYAMTEGAPDQGVYQLAPYGWGPGMGTEVGYRPYNPGLGSYPPGPANGMIGGSLQTGGFSFPGGAMQGGGMNGGSMGTGGYSQPMMAPPASGGQPVPVPDPAVRYSPNRNNPLLGQASAEEIANQPKPSWNPFKRSNGSSVPSGVQPAGYNSPKPTNGPAQPAGYQSPRGRY
ncbi:MAG: pilus assembly protein CpaC [Planctomycetota bacterium]|nr:MAG: pilus assembly protein CpaC [Planctomycetota bacterium]